MKKMNEGKKLIERNIELSAEFSRYLFEHPEIEEQIPMDAEIILLPEFDKARVYPDPRFSDGVNQKKDDNS